MTKLNEVVRGRERMKNSLIITKLIPENQYLLNYEKFNSESDILVTKEIAEEIFRLQKSKKEQQEVLSLIYRVIKELGGTSELLSIVGSYGDTLLGKEVKKELTEWLDSQGETNKGSIYSNWNWNKQLVALLLNPKDKKAKEYVISKKETPILFEQLVKMAKNFFTDKEQDKKGKK